MSQYPRPAPWLTVEEVAGHLKISTKQIRVWLRLGRLRGRKIGKAWRIPPAALDDFLASWS